ncbi:MAG TPA: glycosyltransferase family 87 protein, partial [Anaerolineales bacterium]|nr:glycosyltransferase family 87 protein [Anaerolineales bacterium]
MKIALAGLALLVIITAASLLPVRPYLDFQVLYHANLGVLRGIPLYDQAGQANMIAGLAGVSSDRVFVLPFPYPPWYALSTLWLAQLPIALAARVWFALNLLMLFVCLWLLTSWQSARKGTLLFFVGGLFWLPVLGTLFVGQYALPVLVGAALMIRALSRENPLLVGLAGALLTFKPHLGIVVLILVSVWLARRGDAFGRHALLAMLGASLMLFCAGFLASPDWPANYHRSLLEFREVEGVAACTQCISLAVDAARAVGRVDQAMIISAVGGALLVGWLLVRRRQLPAAPSSLVAGALLVTLMLSPYLLNYDYLRRLVPFILLARKKRT